MTPTTPPLGPRLDAIGVFCDLSRTFDCVNHGTYLYKLVITITTAVKLVISYLNFRQQQVQINHNDSAEFNSKRGLRFGPYLFLFKLSVYCTIKFIMVLFAHYMYIFIFRISLQWCSERQMEQVYTHKSAMMATSGNRTISASAAARRMLRDWNSTSEMSRRATHIEFWPRVCGESEGNHIREHRNF